MADYKKLIQKLLEAGGENSSKAIQALKTGESRLPSFLRNAEEAVVEDPRLVKQATKRILPDIETTATHLADDLALPPPSQLSLPPGAGAIADDVVSAAMPKQGMSNLSKGLAIGAGGAGLGAVMMDGSLPPEEEPTLDTSVPAHILTKANRQLPSGTKPDIKDSLKTKVANTVQDAFKDSLNPEQTQPVAQAPADNFDSRLAGARDEDSKRELLFGLLRAAQQGGSALAGSKADTSFADTELTNKNKFANILSADEKLKKENKEKLDEDVLRDPNSDISKQARAIAKKVGLNVNDSTTALQLKTAGLPIGNLLSQQNAIDARHEDNKFKYAMLNQNKADKKEADTEKQQNKDAIAFDKAVDYGSKARGALGEAKSVFDRSERLNAMFSTLPQNAKGEYDFGKVDPLQKAEMVKAIDTIISGKSTIGGSQELTKASTSFKDELAHLKQYVLGDGLVPLGQQQTVKKLYDTIQRERDITGWQLAKNAASTAKSYGNLKDEDKARVIAERFGVSPEDQELLSTHRLMPGMLLNLKQKGIDPKAALEMLKSGKQYKDIIGQAPNLTTIDKTPSQNIQPVVIRNKQTGKTKIFPADSAQKYLTDPRFERVQ